MTTPSGKRTSVIIDDDVRAGVDQFAAQARISMGRAVNTLLIEALQANGLWSDHPNPPEGTR